MRVTADNLTDGLEKILDGYTAETATAVKAAVREVAKEAKSDVKSESPVDTGKYKKGWTMKVAFESSKAIRVTIHNKVYQLTHLLEYGHALRQGGRTRAIPHIQPTRDKAEKKLRDVIIRKLK